MQEKAAAELSAAMKRVEELEAEVAQLRTSSRAVMSLFQLPSKEDVLAGACAVRRGCVERAADRRGQCAC